MSTFTPVKRDGRRVYVSGMAASSIANKSYALSRCDCGAEVAWAKSSKSGKWYPCETHEYMTDAGHPRHRAAPYQPHKCIVPEPVVEQKPLAEIYAPHLADLATMAMDYEEAGDQDSADKVRAASKRIVQMILDEKA